MYVLLVVAKSNPTCFTLFAFHFLSEWSTWSSRSSTLITITHQNENDYYTAAPPAACKTRYIGLLLSILYFIKTLRYIYVCIRVVQFTLFFLFCPLDLLVLKIMYLQIKEFWISIRSRKRINIHRVLWSNLFLRRERYLVFRRFKL